MEAEGLTGWLVQRCEVPLTWRGGWSEGVTTITHPLSSWYRSIILGKFLGSSVCLVLVKISLVFCFVSY